MTSLAATLSMLGTTAATAQKSSVRCRVHGAALIKSVTKSVGNRANVKCVYCGAVPRLVPYLLRRFAKGQSTRGRPLLKKSLLCD
jgi:hypothetical protein